jgi:hypothetical protein
MTPTQQSLAKKLANPRLRERVITAIQSGWPMWVVGFKPSDQADIEEVLREQGDRP